MSTSKAKSSPPTASSFITAYGPRLRVSVSFSEQGRTKQSFKDECDINIIMARYMKTGVVNFVNRFSPQYSDVSSLDYQDAMLKITQAQSMFRELPSDLRANFNNDPAAFLAFVQDPDNRPQMAEMGLLTPQATQALAKAAERAVAPPDKSSTVSMEVSPPDPKPDK